MASRNWKLLQDTFEAGIKTDEPRGQSPRGSMRACLDMVPRLGGDPIRTRNVWGNFGSAGGAGSYIEHLYHAPFPAGAEIAEVQSAGQVYSVDELSGVRSAIVGTLDSVPLAKPVYYRDLVVFPSVGSPSRMATWDGGAALTHLGSEPFARFLAPYKARLLAAYITGNKNRLFVSDNAATPVFDATNNIYDLAAGEILGLAGLRSAAFAFHADSVTRIRGTTPGAFGDFELDNAFWPVGIAYNGAKSITYWKDNVIWLDGRGVYMSDGASFVNLVEQGGIRSSWTYDFSPSSNYLPVCSVYQDWLFVHLQDLAGAGAANVTWVCYLPKRAWFNFSNFPFRCMAERSAKSGSGLYAGRADTNRLASLSGIFASTNNGLTDGNGVGVTGGITLQFLSDGPGKTQLGRLWVGYGLRDNLAAATVAASVKLQPSGGDIHNLATLPHTSTSTLQGHEYARTPLYIGKRGDGLTISLAQVAPALQFALYSLELEFDPLERYH